MELLRIALVGIFILGTIGICILTAKVIGIGFGFGPRARTITMGIGVILPILLLLGMIISRSGGYILLTQIIATLSAIAFYVIAGAVLVAIIMEIYTKVTGESLPQIISITVLSLGFLCGIIGVLQTQMVVVREETVTHSNLPDEWDGMRAVLVSDTHYGTLIGARSAARVVKKIESLSPEIVLHAGDLFDGPKIDGDTVLAPWRSLTQTTPVFYATGNHEVYGDYGQFVEYAENAGFTSVHNTPSTYKGVTITGIPYISKEQVQAAQDLLDQKPLNEGSPILFINHHPAFIEQIENYGAFLLVAGHTHRGQFWPIRYLVRAIYGKYHYGKHHYENLTTLTTSGTGFSSIPQKFLTPPEIVLITFRKS